MKNRSGGGNGSVLGDRADGAEVRDVSVSPLACLLSLQGRGGARSPI